MIDIIPSRHRSLALLAAVLLVQLLLLAVQIKRQNEVRLIRVWAVTLVSPVQKGAAYTVDKISGVWTNYVDLRNAREDNERLRAEINDMKLRWAELQSRAAEADRLTALLEFRNAHPEAPMLVARVIGGSAVGASKTIILNRGSADGVKKNMAVITPEGAIGKVLDVYGRESQVLLLTDRESGVGAMLTSKRTQGVVRGTGEPDAIMDYVVNDEEVAVGERIVTSGQDRIFPKDLPIGSVVEATPGSPFKRIRVRPAARLDRLEEVLILITQAELAPKEAPADASQPKATPPAKAEASRSTSPPSQ